MGIFVCAVSKGTRRPLGNWESGLDAENTSACMCSHTGMHVHII